MYKWLKSLWFFDEHASNIDKLVNKRECRLYVMKSHDYHVFMQKLIPIAYRDLVSKEILDTFIEISNFLEIFIRANCIPNI